jgi:hypothetical protein
LIDRKFKLKQLKFNDRQVFQSKTHLCGECCQQIGSASKIGAPTELATGGRKTTSIGLLFAAFAPLSEILPAGQAPMTLDTYSVNRSTNKQQCEMFFRFVCEKITDHPQIKQKNQ